jgi:IclR family acetate operon transcriptional repressor
MAGVKEIQSVRNACLLLEAVAAAQPVGVSDLARTIGIDKSAAHRLAVTLHTAGWLERTASGRWRVATSFLALTQRAATDSMVTELRPVLQQLRDETGETTFLVAVEGDRLRVLDVVESRHALRISPAGPYLPLRHSSAARAVAAHLPADELAVLRAADPDIDDETLRQVRRSGFAINDREIVVDTRVVGAPILGPDGYPQAAVIVAAPTSRVDLDQMKRIGALLAGKVQQRKAKV